MIKRGHHSKHFKAEIENIILKSSFKYVQYNVNGQDYGVSRKYFKLFEPQILSILAGEQEKDLKR